MQKNFSKGSKSKHKIKKLANKKNFQKKQIYQLYREETSNHFKSKNREEKKLKFILLVRLSQ